LVLKEEIKRVGEEIKSKGLPNEVSPLVIGVLGYGNVGQGALEIIDLFPHKEISPKELLTLDLSSLSKENVILKCVFKEEDLVEPKAKEKVFNLYDYYKNPNDYKPVFSRYAPYLSIIVNAIQGNSIMRG
jgi:alpha-aminoadipic semialdehyde synthase